jgi:type II secretory pathway pseudopilin PulG
LLVVISIVAVIASVVLTGFEPSMHDQVRGAAQIVAADLAAAQALAVTNNTSYQITFDRRQNLYYLEHSGSNTALDTLPSSAFGLPSDPDTRRTTDLARLPLGATTVRLYVVQGQLDELTYSEQVTTLEFGPLGETKRSIPTTIWLTAGRDRAARYIPLTVNPITGIATIGEYQSESPFLMEDALEDASSPDDETPGDEYDYDYDYGTGDEEAELDPASPDAGTGSFDDMGDGSL